MSLMWMPAQTTRPPFRTALSACGTSEPDSPAQAHPLTPVELDKKLREQVKTVVVIYAENRSFNNLFAISLA